MKNINKKITVLDIQTIGTSLFIVSLIVTLILTYNQKQYTLHKKPLFSTKKTYVISNLNRILVLISVLIFLYCSYQLREISKQKKNNLKLNNLDILASLFSVVGAIIVLYITAVSPIEDALDIANPNI